MKRKRTDRQLTPDDITAVRAVLVVLSAALFFLPGVSPVVAVGFAVVAGLVMLAARPDPPR